MPRLDTSINTVYYPTIVKNGSRRHSGLECPPAPSESHCPAPLSVSGRGQVSKVHGRQRDSGSPQLERILQGNHGRNGLAVHGSRQAQPLGTHGQQTAFAGVHCGSIRRGRSLFRVRRTQRGGTPAGIHYRHNLYQLAENL